MCQTGYEITSGTCWRLNQQRVIGALAAAIAARRVRRFEQRMTACAPDDSLSRQELPARPRPPIRSPRSGPFASPGPRRACPHRKCRAAAMPAPTAGVRAPDRREQPLCLPQARHLHASGGRWKDGWAVRRRCPGVPDWMRLETSASGEQLDLAIIARNGSAGSARCGNWRPRGASRQDHDGARRVGPAPRPDLPCQRPVGPSNRRQGQRPDRYATGHAGLHSCAIVPRGPTAEREGPRDRRRAGPWAP